jgi:hypothetical protein
MTVSGESPGIPQSPAASPEAGLAHQLPLAEWMNPAYRTAAFASLGGGVASQHRNPVHGQGKILTDEAAL